MGSAIKPSMHATLVKDDKRSVKSKMKVDEEEVVIGIEAKSHVWSRITAHWSD
jgi:hypothetical protein